MSYTVQHGSRRIPRTLTVLSNVVPKNLLISINFSRRNESAGTQTVDKCTITTGLWLLLPTDGVT